MGYIRGLVHGTAVGTVVGLCVAPQTGDKTRAQLRWLRAAAREGCDTTGRALQRAKPMASGAVQLVASARHRGEHAANGTASTTGARRLAALACRADRPARSAWWRSPSPQRIRERAGDGIEDVHRHREVQPGDAPRRRCVVGIVEPDQCEQEQNHPGGQHDLAGEPVWSANPANAEYGADIRSRTSRR